MQWGGDYGSESVISRGQTIQARLSLRTEGEIIFNMRPMSSNALLILGISLLRAGAAASCPSVPGSEQVWSKTSVHWVLIGEMHGSNETPEVFGNLVCDALVHERKVTVALERPTKEQAALDGILTGSDLAKAEKTLLAEPDWQNGMDGRASEAMLRLLVSLRKLRKQHRGLKIAAFDSLFTGDSAGARDQAMGGALLALGRSMPQSIILVLTGNVHAMQSPLFGYDFAAMYLPARERISLEVTDTGGKAWAAFDGACGSSSGGVETKGKSTPYGIFFDPSLAPYGKVDGVLSLAVPLTSSPPAAGEPSPLPPCRVKFLSEHPPKP
jgi:hypothetical protein